MGRLKLGILVSLLSALINLYANNEPFRAWVDETYEKIIKIAYEKIFPEKPDQESEDSDSISDEKPSEAKESPDCFDDLWAQMSDQINPARN